MTHPEAPRPTVERAARDLINAVLAAADEIPDSHTSDAPDALEAEADRKDYRSFYVGDNTFLPFRDAIYWSARHPGAVGMDVPENMSAAIEEYMREVTARLQSALNNGDPFPPAPSKTRKRA